MTTVVVAPYNVASFPEAGGHFWVYMQYAAALAAMGVDIYWLEQFHPTGDETRDANSLSLFFIRMGNFGFDQKVILYQKTDQGRKFLTMKPAQAEEIIDRTDLLFNFHYTMDPELLARFRRTALIDIDPGLLQFWVAHNQLQFAPHDVYFTTGETVGTKRALFPDCGLTWNYVPPAVFLDAWPYTYSDSFTKFTTVSSWWGKEYITNGKDILFENNKRVSFLDYIELPKLTSQPLELALSFGEDEEQERSRLENFGWDVQHAFQVANSPEAYRSYIQHSRGEFSCVKPSCIYFQNAWISDRTLCYLASGKPAVVQDTGPSSYLPNEQGLYRFKSMEEAVRFFEKINSNYEEACKTARVVAEEYFDARKSVGMILSHGL